MIFTQEESTNYYDREGRRISEETYSQLFEDLTYRIIKETQINEDYFLTTSWLGTDHSYEAEEAPLIFQTLIYHNEQVDEMWKHSTELDATEHHEKVIKEFL